VTAEVTFLDSGIAGAHDHSARQTTVFSTPMGKFSHLALNSRAAVMGPCVRTDAQIDD
jgi:hypothetical protein